MGDRYRIEAAHYPFRGHYEKTFGCQTLWVALKYFREYKHQGYEIINVYYRGM